jgi:hypothetical protein
MKRDLLLVFALLSFLFGKAQVNIPSQEISYDVHYHWGLIDVMIAHGTVTLESSGDSFKGTLDGSSIPWDGRVFCVSDTLHATMTPASPYSKETVTYENGWYLKPKVTVYRSGHFNPTDPANYKNIKGEGSLDASANTMEAITVTADMLGMFYYFHEFDFESITEGSSFTLPIAVAGGTPQSVKVTYNGKSSYTATGVTYPTYSVEFEYSYNGAMTGYPVHAEVATNSRIPVLLSASLPVGKVEMIYAH